MEGVPMTNSLDALKSIETIIKPGQVLWDQDSCKNYGRDWTTYFDIYASAVVFPESTEDVISIVRWARQYKISLIPSGGRTGLSGAAVATRGEVVVSFDRMNKIYDFNKINGSVRVEAGVVTETLQEFARDNGFHYPVDFAAKGSSQIGGNIATNAGGIKVLRYGLTRDWIVSLKVVTGAGELMELNHGLIKNATGPDLRHLIIGSEGTLGFIVEATVRLAPPPPPLKVLLLGVASLEAVMEIYAAFKGSCSLTAFEMFSNLALKHVLLGTDLTAPFSQECPYYIVAELEMASDKQEETALEIFSSCLEMGWIMDGLLSQSETQAKTMWRYREQISESLSKYSPYKNDISITIANAPKTMEDLDTLLASRYPTWEVVWFGHVGDGNLHINILRPDGMTKEAFVAACQNVDHEVFSVVQKYHGSISAEHGVGLTKKKFLSYCRSQVEIEILKGIKQLFDPDGIMNPGKIFDSDHSQ